MRDSLIDISGNRYGMLTAIKHVGKGKWLCRCDCGRESIHYGHHLRRGAIKSCGCVHYVNRGIKQSCDLPRESRDRLYHIWRGMKDRCFNPSSKNYELYGGKGIKVCNEWLEFPAFMEWSISHGYTDELSIDRINGNGDYCPENCRWATAIEQSNNRYTNKYIEFNGKRLSYSQWARETGLHKNTIRMRILSGWSVEDCLNTPAWKKPNSKT